jgi:tyrosinase
MDRIMTLYQSRYPDLWVEDAPQAMETYTMKRDSVQGPDSVLAPFHMNAKGDMWTSSLTRNWTSLGYTYPELVDSPSNDTLTRTINKLYKSTTQGGLKNTNNNDTISTLSLGTGPDATDWLALVKMPADIKISYSVRAFLGTPDADPKNWPTDPNYVGQIASLSSPRMSSTTILTGHISLTNKLAAKFASGDLKSLDKSAVTDWLKTNFHWRIQALDFTEIPREHPPKGLNVTVFSVPVHLPHSETDVPVWAGALEYKPEIVGNPPESKGPDYSGKTGRFDEGKGTWEWNMTDVTEREKVVSSSRAGEEARASPTAKPVPVAGPVSLGVGASASASAGVSGSAGSSSLPAAASSSSAVQAGGDRSSPVTQAPATSSASPTPSAPGQSVVLETLGNGEVVTKIVTVVVPVTVYA